MKRFAVTSTLVLLILVANVDAGLGQQATSLADRIQTIRVAPQIAAKSGATQFFLLYWRDGNLEILPANLPQASPCTEGKPQ